MSFGEKLQKARKDKNLSQQEVAKKIGTRSPVIGRYERDEMKPSIEVAAKIAELLDISLDYLVGHTDIEVDKTIFDKIVAVSKFSKEDKEHILSVIDAFVAKRKIQSII